MARPRGQFDAQKELCFQMLKGLARPTCWAGNVFIAKKLGVSIRQVTRYLAALVKEGRIALHVKRYLKEGIKTRRFIHLLNAVKKGWAKPMYSTPPSGNRYKAPETVTETPKAPETVTETPKAPETVKPPVVWAKPVYDMVKTAIENVGGVEREIPQEAVGPSPDTVLAEMDALLARDAAREAAEKAREAADPKYRIKKLERTMRIVDRMASKVIDVSHKVPKEQ